MSLIGKLEGEIKVKATNGGVFYDIYKNRPNDFSKFSPNIVQSVKLQSGSFGSPGATLTWVYTIQGETISMKSEIEGVDDAKQWVKEKVVEGVVLDQYKSFYITGEVEPIDQESSMVKWTLDYEKLQPSVPEPSAIMDALVNVVKDIDVKQ